MTTNGWINKLLLFALFSIGGFVVWVVLLMVYPQKVFEINRPITFNQTTAHPGGVVTYTIDYCKYYDIPAQIIKHLHNDIIIALPETSSNREVGCFVRDTPLVIPNEVGPGTYVLKITLVYRVNFLREIRHSFITNPIEVIEPNTR